MPAVPERAIVGSTTTNGEADRSRIDGGGPEGAGTGTPAARMAIGVLSLIGFFIAIYMLLHKIGLVGTLVCGTGDCGVVQASRWAVFLGLPVPAWGVAGYGLILLTALIGLQPRWIDDRRLGLLLVALSTVAFVFSAYLTAIEAFVLHAWCRWCVVSAVIATLIFLASLTELRRPSTSYS